LRQAQRVGRDLRLDRRTHVGRGAEEAVSRHEPVEPLVRTLEVVVLHVELEPSQAVCEVGKHRAPEKLVPQRLPEAFDLAERLRVLRSALAVRDAVAAQPLLEVRFAAPRGVLPTVVGEHLARLAVLRDAAFERLHHQARLLMVRERKRHQVPRVVVHERRDVQTLIAAQLEGEDVALPQLIWFRALESPRRPRPLLHRGRCRDQAGLVQDPPDLGLRDSQSREALEHIPDASRAPFRMLLPQRDDLVPFGSRGLLRLRHAGHCRRGGPRHLQLQRVDAAGVEQPHELLHHRHRHAERHRDVSVFAPTHHRLDDAQPHVVRHWPVPQPRLPCLLLRHLSASMATRVTGPEATGAMRSQPGKPSY
jgi:hypothetical protein